MAVIQFKFTVFNHKDIDKYLSKEQKEQLAKICRTIESNRLKDGKKLNNYWVCNTDEHYAESIIKTIIAGEDDKEKISYTDKNGNVVKIGDRLKFEKPIIENRTEYSCPEPIFRLELIDGTLMLYVSGMDEYHEVSEWQSEDDEPYTLKHFERLED